MRVIRKTRREAYVGQVKTQGVDPDDMEMPVMEEI